MYCCESSVWPNTLVVVELFAICHIHVYVQLSGVNMCSEDYSTWSVCFCLSVCLLHYFSEAVDLHIESTRGFVGIGSRLM